MKTLHQYLKDATQGLHRQLDHHPLFTSLLSADASIADIQKGLQFWWGFHCAAQTSASQQQFNQWTAFLASRDKLGALKNDLDRLQITPFFSEFNWPHVSSVAELIALLYVTEGSSLGGVAIQNVLQKSTRNYPVRLEFLTLYEPNTYRYWQEFLGLLDEVSTQIETTEVQTAAADWFKALIAYADTIHQQTRNSAYA